MKVAYDAALNPIIGVAAYAMAKAEERGTETIATVRLEAQFYLISSINLFNFSIILYLFLFIFFN